MGSRREEDRNEKIIRGLMKLPPNRHCINCNSLGPQYVCTNFWTFVCVTCSGIHREFTHRVKSVSMSKFTSQEVDALQNGGNQRAKEIYFKGWDHQRQRFPDNSNADKVREFIKNVYEEKKYAEGITHGKPPRDLQSLRSLDETRRASSYHSYSQSPPYDFQYEDQRYGKQGATLTRKPGSDRGIYVEKMSSFICSPTRISEDKFENEGSVSRFSDFSVSSGGDPVRSGTESPSFQKAYAPQRTMSSGSIGTISVKSCNSGHEPEYDAGFRQDNIVNISQSSAPLTNGTVDLSGASIVTSSEAHASSSVDLFELPGAPSVDLFQAVPHGSASSTDICLPSQTSSPLSLDLFSGGVRNQSVSHMDKKSAEPSALSNEGWANFDSPLPAAPSQRPQALTSVPLPSGVGSSAKFDKVSSRTANSWLVLQNSGPQGSSLISDPWKEGLQNFSAPVEPIDAQKWNAFDNSSIVQLPLQNIRPNSEPQSTADGPLLTANQHTISRVSEDYITDGFQRATSYEGFPGPTGNLDFVMGPKYVHSLMEDARSNATSHRSTNPFDLPYECDLEPTHMFLDMSSLQAALPDTQVPTTFLGVTQPWFDQDPVTTYVPAAAQGGLAYMAGQAPTPQLANVQPQGPVVGGNPFA